MSRPRMVVVAGLVVAGLALAPALAACSSGGGRPKVAAVVDGVKIPSAETEALLRAYIERRKGEEGKGEEGKEEPDRKELIRFVLIYQIRLAELDQLAAQAGVPFDPDPASELAQSVPPEEFSGSGMRPEDLVRSVQAGRLSKAMAEKLFPDVPVSDDDLRAEYDGRERLNASSWRVAARIAYFTSPDPAGQLGSRLAKGEAFDQAASALGATQTGSADITPISPLPAQVLEAVGKLAQGQLSPPVQVGTSGWATILAERREELPRVTFEAARGDLTRFLQDQRRQGLFADYFAKELHGAKVTVSRYYGRWDEKAATVR